MRGSTRETSDDLAQIHRYRKRDGIMPDTLRDSVASEAEAILLSVVHTVYQHDTYVDVAVGRIQPLNA